MKTDLDPLPKKTNMNDQEVHFEINGMWLLDKKSYDNFKDSIFSDPDNSYEPRALASLIRDFWHCKDPDELSVGLNPERAILFKQDPVLAALVMYSDLSRSPLLMRPHLECMLSVGQASEKIGGLCKHLLEALKDDTDSKGIARYFSEILENNYSNVPALNPEHSFIKEFEKDRAEFRWASTGYTETGLPPVLPTTGELRSYLLLTQAIELGSTEIKVTALEAMRNFDRPFADLLEKSLKHRFMLY